MYYYYDMQSVWHLPPKGMIDLEHPVDQGAVNIYVYINCYYSMQSLLIVDFTSQINTSKHVTLFEKK